MSGETGDTIVRQYSIETVHWMPTTPPRPAPFILTDEEVCVFLRLAKEGETFNAAKKLCHYRNSGQLRGVRVGAHVRFRLEDVLDFLETKRA